MGKKFKFEFYGWYLPIAVVIGLMLNAIPILGAIPFLGGIIAAYIYAKWKTKKIDFNFVVNIILAELIVIFVLSAIIAAILITFGVML